MRTYQNPLIAKNCPDPAVVRIGGAYVLACTSNAEPDSFPLYRSTDLVEWKPLGHIFPRGKRPSWTTTDFWAPEIHPVGDRLNVYYTARDQGGQLCVGLAWAEQPEGPWTDLGKPFIRDERVGMIDSHHFHDPPSGKRYLYWKSDGNGLSPKEPTSIFVQELSADGKELLKERTVVLVNDQPWEGDLVEGPWVVHRAGWYFLFYSGNTYFNEKYAEGVARAKSPLGPFEKKKQVLLKSSRHWLGPGHCCVIQDKAGNDFHVCHASPPGKADGNHRMVVMDRVRYVDGWPAINDGTVDPGPQPRPTT